MLPTNVGVGTKAIAAADVVSPAWPTHLANDIGILAVEYEGGTNPPTPAGWTAFSDSPVAYGGGAMALFWRRAETASESAPTVGAGDNDHVVAGIVAFRRCYELDQYQCRLPRGHHHGGRVSGGLYRRLLAG
jgi:hypothetical protein